MRADKINTESGQERDFQQILSWADQLRAQKQVDVDTNWQRFSRRIHREPKRKRFLRGLQTAAAILLIPVLVVSIYFYKQVKEMQALSTKKIELTTAYGVISKVELPDGSEVWLNSGSTLTYPERFTGEHREVYLSGEAYFKVESDKQHRFDVCTREGIIVSAYGTEFNVQAYEEEANIEATLAEGGIQVSFPQLSISQQLVPGEQAVFSKKEQQMSLQSVSLLTETAWKDGKIVFRRTPMNEVARQLSRHFNVEVELQDREIYEYSYSGTFTTETLSEILSLLELTSPIRCEIIYPQSQNNYSFTRKKVLIKALE